MENSCLSIWSTIGRHASMILIVIVQTSVLVTGISLRLPAKLKEFSCANINILQMASSHLKAPKNHFRFTYQLKSRTSIFSITKLLFNSENIVIYDRQMSHYEIYYYNSIIYLSRLLSVGMSLYIKTILRHHTNVSCNLY